MCPPHPSSAPPLLPLESNPEIPWHTNVGGRYRMTLIIMCPLFGGQVYLRRSEQQTGRTSFAFSRATSASPRLSPLRHSISPWRSVALRGYLLSWVSRYGSSAFGERSLSHDRKPTRWPSWSGWRPDNLGLPSRFEFDTAVWSLNALTQTLLILLLK